MKAATFIDYADKGQQMQRQTENTAGNNSSAIRGLLFVRQNNDDKIYNVSQKSYSSPPLTAASCNRCKQYLPIT